MPKANAPSMTDSASVETELCTFTWLEPRLLLQRFKPTMRFEQPLLDAVARSRNALIGDDAQCALLVVIPEEVPVNPEATNVDHFTGERTHRRILAMALVAEDMTMRGVSKFYLQWFPQVFPAAVLDSVQEAAAWLRGKLSAHH